MTAGKPATPPTTSGPAPSMKKLEKTERESPQQFIGLILRKWVGIL
jgi:hypothetical protein